MTSLYYYAACSLFGTFLGVSTVDMFPEFFIENPLCNLLGVQHLPSCCTVLV